MTEQKRIHMENQMMTEELQVDSKELKNKINEMYTDVALNPNEDYHFKMGRDLAESLGYPASTLDLLPTRSIESFAGVGYFFDLVEIDRGDRVLDLGSGSGMDAFFAARQVKEKGEVIGVDMNQDQLDKARKLRDSYAVDNTTFVKADIEDLPFEDESFDFVISNGVFNLVPNKQRIFHEVQRILKPGGKLVFSDIVSDSPLPDDVKCDSDLWASCIGGAEQRDNYIHLIERANLRVEKTKHHNEYSFISNQAVNASEEWGVKSYSFLCSRSDGL